MIRNLLKDITLYKYFLAAGLAAGTDLTLFYYGIKILSLSWLQSASISFILATAVNYFLCSAFVFQKQNKNRNRLFKTYLVSSVGILVHHSALYLMLSLTLLPLLISKLFAMGGVFLWNFASRRYWVFAPSSD